MSAGDAYGFRLVRSTHFGRLVKELAGVVDASEEIARAYHVNDLSRLTQALNDMQAHAHRAATETGALAALREIEEAL